MGIALIAFSSLSQPVKALTQFLASPGRAKSAAPSPHSVPATSFAPAYLPVPPLAASQPPAVRPGGQAFAAGVEHCPAPQQGEASSASSALAFRRSGKARRSTRMAMPIMPSRISRQEGPSGQRTAAIPSCAPAYPKHAANADRFHAEEAQGGLHCPPASTDPRQPASLGRPLLRVLRRVHRDDPARLVISGRMADVCAELDRLVASEAQLAV